jgi:hypothetical protein
MPDGQVHFRVDHIPYTLDLDTDPITRDEIQMARYVTDTPWADDEYVMLEYVIAIAMIRRHQRWALKRIRRLLHSVSEVTFDT